MFSFFGKKHESSDNLDFLDQQLTLVSGGNKVLNKLKLNLNCRVLNVNHNGLTDSGIEVIINGLKKYDNVGNELEVLSLSGCKLTNKSLKLISEYFLKPSSNQPTSLTHLQLSANQIGEAIDWNETTLSLGLAISSPLNSLRFLSLTSNTFIGKSGIQPLLNNLRLANCKLAHLQISVCELNPDAAEPLALWLRDPEGGGKTLRALDLNGNHLSVVGVRRIVRSIVSGECTGLIHLSFFSNEQGVESEWKSLIQKLESEETEEEVKNWSHRLSRALQRNQHALEETTKASIMLLSLVRTLMNGNPKQSKSNTELIRDQVESLAISDFNSTTSTSISSISKSPYSPLPTLKPTPFPFLKLPIELQIHILHCTLLLPGSSIAPHYPPILPSPFDSIPIVPNYDFSTTEKIFPYKLSILTERQLAKVLTYGMNRDTLRTVLPGKSDEGREKSEALWNMGCNGFERS